MSDESDLPLKLPEMSEIEELFRQLGLKHEEDRARLLQFAAQQSEPVRQFFEFSLGTGSQIS